MPYHGGSSLVGVSRSSVRRHGGWSALVGLVCSACRDAVVVVGSRHREPFHCGERVVTNLQRLGHGRLTLGVGCLSRNAVSVLFL